MKIKKFLPVIVALALTFTGLTACSTEERGDDEDVTLSENSGVCDMNAVSAEIDSMRISSFAETAEKSEYVKFTVKDYGEFVIRLRADVAPITVDNFQNLVAEKFYDGIIFHRVMKNFMIQGGDPDGDGSGGSDKKIKGEFAANGVRNQMSHVSGVISMARLGNDMNSATSQFFICNDDASYSLDGKYAAFGYVVAGMETVLLISDTEVTYNASGTEKSVPLTKVVIEKVRFVEKQ